MRTVLAAMLLATVLAGCLGASSPDVRVVDPGTLVDRLACGDGAADACNVKASGPGVNEFSVAVNPRDPFNAIVTGNDYGAQGNPVLSQYNRLWGSWWDTHDGGGSWARHTLPGMLPSTGSTLSLYEFVGDMVVAFDAGGTAYVAGIAYTGLTPPAMRNAVFLARSTDGGRTFSEPVLVDAKPTDVLFHDKPALAIDHEDRLFIVWNFNDQLGERGSGSDQEMRLATSTDGGRTWTARPLVRNDQGIGASIAIGADDSVNVAWRAYAPDAIRFARSTDHGATFTPPTLVGNVQSDSTDVPKATYRAFVLPTLVARPDGTLLCTFSGLGPAGDRDVFLNRSTDHGASWTGVRLNQDTGTTAQFLPTVAPLPDGGVVAAWLDRRDDPGDASYRLYAATSRDGGRFTEFRVGRAPSVDPNQPGSVPSTTTFIGDYIGVASAGDRVYFAWPDLREDGKSHLWTAGETLAAAP